MPTLDKLNCCIVTNLFVGQAGVADKAVRHAMHLELIQQPVSRNTWKGLGLIYLEFPNSKQTHMPDNRCLVVSIATPSPLPPGFTSVLLQPRRYPA